MDEMKCVACNKIKEAHRNMANLGTTPRQIKRKSRNKHDFCYAQKENREIKLISDFRKRMRKAGQEERKR